MTRGKGTRVAKNDQLRRIVTKRKKGTQKRVGGGGGGGAKRTKMGKYIEVRERQQERRVDPPPHAHTPLRRGVPGQRACLKNPARERESNIK
jgi:hypothetical protein